MIYDEVLGPEHPDTVASLNNLANLLHSQGDLEGARRLTERSLAIHDNAFGPEHPNTNRVRDNLVRLLSDMGHADEALARSQPGPGSNKKVLGPDHRESKVSAGVSTQHQRVVKGNEGHPYSPPSRSSSSSSSTTAKEVGIETKRARIFARSKPEKTRQSPPQIHPPQKRKLRRLNANLKRSGHSTKNAERARHRPVGIVESPGLRRRRPS